MVDIEQFFTDVVVLEECFRKNSDVPNTTTEGVTGTSAFLY